MERFRQHRTRGYKERVRYATIPKHKNERIGIPTGLLDCNGNEIITGSFYRLEGTHMSGPVMWNRHQDAFGVFYGLWYGDKQVLNPDVYGKFCAINKDQGMRMNLVPISEDECYDA